MNYAQGGLAALQKKAQQVEKASRAPDTTLVHMAPNEIAALRQLAMEQYGTDLPRNPKTGLYEAGILSSLLGLGLSFIPGVGPLMAAGIMGGGTLLTGGKPQDALMNALGAYGGASLGAGLAGAAGQGAAAAGVEGAKEAALAANPNLAEMAAKEAAKSAIAAPPTPVLSDAVAGQNLQTLENAYLRNAANAGEAATTAPTSEAMISGPSPVEAMNQRITATRMMNFPQDAAAMPPASAASASPNYADLSLTDKMGYAGQHIAKDPWNFMTKEVGTGPSTIVASSLMGGSTGSGGINKRAPTFYTYDYDPITGTFKNERASSKPHWQAAKGGLAAAAQYAKGESVSATPEQMQAMRDGVAAMQSANAPQGLMGQWDQLVAGLNGQSNQGSMAQGGVARGRLLHGPGDGVSDAIPAMIDGQQHAALSTDEYVVPARVVAELGNGSSTAGAKKLDAMLARVEAAARKVKRGKDSRADRYLPA